MQPRTKEKIIREILIWVQYFVISFLAAIWAYDSYITKHYGPPGEGLDVNLMGLLRGMWSTYLAPWLAAFLFLCAMRFLIVFFFSGRLKGRLIKGSDDQLPLSDLRKS